MDEMKLARALPAERPWPEGRFVLLPVRSAVSAWWKLSVFEFRVWLALHEVVEIRRAAKKARGSGRRARNEEPKYEAAEVARLVGASESSVRRAVRRLETLTLAKMEANQVTMCSTTPGWWLEEFLDGVPKLVPIPRRLLRELCRVSQGSLVAAALGHAFRCLRYYRKDGVCRGRGRCSAWWVSHVFGVSMRSVHRGRSELRKWRWLLCVEDSRVRGQAKSSANEHGPKFVVNLLWRRETRERMVCQASQRLSTGILSGLPPRIEKQRPPSEKEQRPGLRRSLNSRFLHTASRGRNRLTEQDLADPARLLTVAQKLQEHGYAKKTEAAILQVFSCAVRALERGEKPVRLFAALVKRGLWHYPTNEHEDKARGMLRKARDGTWSGGDADAA